MSANTNTAAILAYRAMTQSASRLESSRLSRTLKRARRINRLEDEDEDEDIYEPITRYFEEESCDFEFCKEDSDF